MFVGLTVLPLVEGGFLAETTCDPHLPHMLNQLGCLWPCNFGPSNLLNTAKLLKWHPDGLRMDET